MRRRSPSCSPPKAGSCAPKPNFAGPTPGSQSVKELYEKGIEVSIRNQKSYRQSDAAAAWTEKKLTAPDWAAIDDAAISSYINDDTSSPEGYTDPWKPEYNSDPTTSITVKWDEGASNEEKLERIITQKWIANFPLSTEAWADYRRTGYPKLFRPKQNLAPSIIDTQLGPRRLLYNETELSSNTVEVNNAIQLLKAESSEVKGDGDTGGTRPVVGPQGQRQFLTPPIRFTHKPGLRRITTESFFPSDTSESGSGAFPTTIMRHIIFSCPRMARTGNGR